LSNRTCSNVYADKFAVYGNKAQRLARQQKS